MPMRMTKLLVTTSNCTLGGQVLESLTNRAKLQVKRYFVLNFFSFPLNHLRARNKTTVMIAQTFVNNKCGALSALTDWVPNFGQMGQELLKNSLDA